MFEATRHTVNHHCRAMAGRGVLSVAVGLVAMLWPDVTVGVLVMLFGTCAIADGALSLVGATRETTPDRGWQTAAGVGSIAVGIITVVWPSITALGLVALIGAWFIVSGVEHVAAAIHIPRSTPSRGVLGIAGAVAVLFGTYLIAYPGPGAVTLATAIGLFAIARGVTLIVAVAASRRKLNDAATPATQVAA